MYYRERIFPPRGLHVLFALIFVVGSVGTAVVWVLEGDPILAALVMTLLATVLPACLVLSHLHVRVDDQYLTATLFPFFRKRFRLADIADVGVVRVGPAEFGGYGYRLGSGGRAGFIMFSGLAVEFTAGDDRRYVITTMNSEVLAETLKKRGA